jgi:1,4-alpha-glucan branching enzyme
MIHKTFVETDSGLVARVTFTLPNNIWADAFYLVGDFNDWNRTSHPFPQDREGQWSITVDLELGRASRRIARASGASPLTWSWAGPSSSATCAMVKSG